MRESFGRFLVDRGYKEWTLAGNPSTVYDYVKRIDKVCEWEGCSWETLSARIDSVVADYDVGGRNQYRGATSHNAVISALKQFRLFCNR